MAAPVGKRVEILAGPYAGKPAWEMPQTLREVIGDKPDCLILWIDVGSHLAWDWVPEKVFRFLE